MRYIGEICRRRGAHSRFLNHKTEAIASVREAERGRRMFSNGKISSAPSFHPVESPSLKQPMEVLVWQAAGSQISHSSFAEAVDRLGKIPTIASSHDVQVRKREQIATYRQLAKENKLTAAWRKWGKKHRKDLESKHPRRPLVFRPKQRKVSLIGFK